MRKQTGGWGIHSLFSAGETLHCLQVNMDVAYLKHPYNQITSNVCQEEKKTGKAFDEMFSSKYSTVSYKSHSHLMWWMMSTGLSNLDVWWWQHDITAECPEMSSWSFPACMECKKGKIPPSPALLCSRSVTIQIGHNWNYIGKSVTSKYNSNSDPLINNIFHEAGTESFTHPPSLVNYCFCMECLLWQASFSLVLALPMGHSPAGAADFSAMGTETSVGGTEFVEIASGGNALSCFLNLNFLRYVISRNSCVGAAYVRKVERQKQEIAETNARLKII